ncbi:MAG: type VI secretion system baseplate subunit TssG [Planctomycetia bacterium]|mgnify:CR=1 FL=1|nr:type VI secretion system baseplate subunit TssG [Planctomycetia bacterium]
MAVSRGQPGADLIERLVRASHRFEFHQAMRLLERLARTANGEILSGTRSVGEDSHPYEEMIRFRSLPTLAFPAASIERLTRIEPAFNGAEKPPFEMSVTFLGLMGSSGTLPQHYTSLVIERCKQKDFSLRDFLDLLNHRSISLFFRASEKYRLPFRYERRQFDPSSRGPDLVTFALLGLVGVATPGLERRLAVDDETLVYYSGFYSHMPRAAAPLERLLADYFALPIEIDQFQGRWQYLDEAQMSRIAGRHSPDSRNRELGRNVVVGRRFWDVQSKFRIRVGPMSYDRFREFLPDGRAMRKLVDLARLYVGDELEFEVQPLLRAGEVPRTRLTRQAPSPSRLGWNSWVHAKPAARDADQARFRGDRLRAAGKAGRPLVAGPLAASSG